MILLFDLSKEHPEIPRLEILSLYDAYQKKYNIIHADENVLIIDANVSKDFIHILSSRLAFTHSLSNFHFHFSSLDEINNIDTYRMEQLDGSIAIRYKNRSKTQKSKEIVQTIASLYTKNCPVDLENPDHEIDVIITDDRIFVGLHLVSLDRKEFEKRKVQFRTFFSPISLHPKLARGLVNISKVVPGNMVLDPFCGTGGFLIEAGIIGCRIYGSDIKTEMVDGTSKNLAQYSLFAEKLFISDIGDISQFLDEDIDVVITDAPYGKSTTTNNEDIQLLYSRAFESIRRILKPNGRIVIGLPNTTYEPLLQHYFTVEQMITLPVHRSLTRYFYIGLKK